MVGRESGCDKRNAINKYGYSIRGMRPVSLVPRLSRQAQDRKEEEGEPGIYCIRDALFLTRVIAYLVIVTDYYIINTDDVVHTRVY